MNVVGNDVIQAGRTVRGSMIRTGRSAMRLLVRVKPYFLISAIFVDEIVKPNGGCISTRKGTLTTAAP
jgi:hypothetical protein